MALEPTSPFFLGHPVYNNAKFERAIVTFLYVVGVRGRQFLVNKYCSFENIMSLGAWSWIWKHQNLILPFFLDKNPTINYISTESGNKENYGETKN